MRGHRASRDETGPGTGGGAIGSLTRRIEQILPSLEYRRMVEVEDREAVYRLRYEGYRREGRIGDRAHRSLHDADDERPNTDSYGIFVRGMLVATIRLSILTPLYPHSPSGDVFGDVLLARVRAGKVIVDPTRLVISPRAMGQFPEMPWLTVRVPIMACIHFGADECLSTVQPQHKAFYERIFRVSRLGEPYYYAPLDMHLELLVNSARTMIDDLRERYPFLHSTYLQRRQLFGQATRVPGVVDDRRYAGTALAA